ncbi:MAG: GNAT family N-acetyltransferase, partial [Shewanella sp.]
MYSIEIEAKTTLTPVLIHQIVELSQQIPELDRPLST